MKLSLDENLSRRLVPALQTAFPGSSQVALLDLGGATDYQIWLYARDNNYAIVTQDADFHELTLLHGGPPPIIWLRCGNQPRSIILNKLIGFENVIKEKLEEGESWILEIL